MDSSGGSFCPVCKIENLSNARYCAFCNAPLDADKGVAPGSPILSELPALASGSSEPARLRLLLFMPGINRPIQVDGSREIILGRNLEKGSGPQGEPIVDLTPYEALDNGVSRQHVLVRPVEDGYEIRDMGSTNGTWLNQTRILPGRHYRLDGESEIRLGRMVLRMVVRIATGQTSPFGTSPLGTSPFSTGSFAR
jgi:hypothetical protein